MGDARCRHVEADADDTVALTVTETVVTETVVTETVVTETVVAEIAENAGATLRARLAEAGLVRDPSGRAPIEREIAHTQRLPQPIEDRRRVAAALTGEEAGSDT